MDNKWIKLEQILTKLIKQSRRSDYLEHAITTREWLLKLNPLASEELQMSAFSHDIERCFFEKMTQIENEEYLPYKLRHSQRCADITCAVMLGLEFPEEFIKKVHHLISHHEVGGDLETDLIRDADSLSFMSNNLPGYLEKRGYEKTKEKVSFMYQRAADEAKKLMREIQYSDELIPLVHSEFDQK